MTYRPAEQWTEQWIYRLKVELRMEWAQIKNKAGYTANKQSLAAGQGQHTEGQGQSISGQGLYFGLAGAVLL